MLLLFLQTYRHFPVKHVCKAAHPGQDSQHLLDMLGSSWMQNSLAGWHLSGPKTPKTGLCKSICFQMSLHW